MVVAITIFTHKKINSEIVCPEEPETPIGMHVYLGSDARENGERKGEV